jgi:hypothetical protein
MPLLHYYGDLSSADSFANLVEDICRLVELNPVEWEGVTLDRADVASRCQENSAVAVYAAIYDILAETWGAKTWCCKSLANVNYLPEIDAYLPHAKYIYLYRDGRDVALSFRKAVVGEKHFYHIAQGWTKNQQKALAMSRKVGPDRFFKLSYEQLTGNSERTLRQLCEFLGVNYHPSMLDFHQSNEASRTAVSSSLWGNVTQSVMANNTRKFLKEASPSDIRIFEAVAGSVLDELGYERTQTAVGEAVSFTNAELAEFAMENERLKAERRETMDDDDRVRRDRQQSVLDEIIQRQLVAAA